MVKGGEEGQPLFVDGNATEMVQQALEFCGQYTREHEQTLAFSKALTDNGLLVERNATVRTPDGREFNLNGFLVVDVLAEIGEELGVEPATVALAWLRQQPSVVAPIASASSVEQVAPLIASMELKLGRAHVNRLNKVSAAFL